uniref:Uncharacterized protein n=1 Tax=Lepeophtheirus salmonis TaxID=72036 RepID=A0A0K2V671_LEPSM
MTYTAGFPFKLYPKIVVEGAGIRAKSVQKEFKRVFQRK